MTLGLVELTNQAQREEGAHVLEVRPNLNTHLVPPGVAWHLGNLDLSLPQGPTTARRGVDGILVGDVLADPLVELVLEVVALLPGTDLLALQHLEVVSDAAHHEHVGKLSAQTVVELHVLALLGLSKGLGTLGAVRREETRVVRILAVGERDEALLAQLELAPLG